jgi:hypothetical protein
MERTQAKNTEYVGRLSDGETLGYWMVLFAQPYRGRAVPFHFGLYSERTLGEEATSRNIEWHKMLLEVKDLVGETPLLFDREFSAQRWLEALSQSGCSWVVRLNKGSGARFTDEEGDARKGMRCPCLSRKAKNGTSRASTTADGLKSTWRVCGARGSRSRCG